jgi:hypothetical protein
MWRKEIWTKKWSRLHVLMLLFVLLAVHLMSNTPKFLYYLRLYAVEAHQRHPQ